MSKHIINGKRYNLDKATEIASDSYGGYSDFRHYSETLYKTAKGAFVLEGEGGPMTRWSRPCDGGVCGGDGAVVLTTAEALEWCERADVNVDVIEAHFDIEEG